MPPACQALSHFNACGLTHRIDANPDPSGSAEEAALALIEDWGTDIGATGDREPYNAAQLTVSYDGGVFRPEP